MRTLAEIEADIHALPRTMWPGRYKKKLDALQAEWKAANVALFDAQVAALEHLRPRLRP
jgi:hypothetical protein